MKIQTYLMNAEEYTKSWKLVIKQHDKIPQINLCDRLGQIWMKHGRWVAGISGWSMDWSGGKTQWNYLYSDLLRNESFLVCMWNIKNKDGWVTQQIQWFECAEDTVMWTDGWVDMGGASSISYTMHSIPCTGFAVFRAVRVRGRWSTGWVDEVVGGQVSGVFWWVVILREGQAGRHTVALLKGTDRRENHRLLTQRTQLTVMRWTLYCYGPSNVYGVES